MAGSLLLVCSADSADEPRDDATTSKPCGPDDVLCQAYDKGFKRGEKALRDGEKVELSPGELADLPSGSDDLGDALAHDAAVARAGCRRLARDWHREFPVEERDEDRREAYYAGCTTGAVPPVGNAPDRYKYEGR